MTAVLADSNAIVWWLTDDTQRLTQPAIEALSAADDEDGIFISAITLIDLWYASQKHRDPITAKQLEAFERAVTDPTVNVNVVPVTHEDARMAWEPPRDAMRDPFDRIVVASARTRHLPLITADMGLRTLGLVEAIW